MRTNWQKNQQKAQGMVEFAMVLPILLMLILAIFAFGHFLFVYITTVSASREAVRYGAALGVSENGIARFQDCKAIRAAARRVGSIAGVTTINIQYDDGANLIEHCTGDTLTNPGNVGLGDRIVVEVTTNYTPIVPFVSIPSFPIHSRSVRTIYRDLTVGNAAPAQPVGSTKTNTTLTIISDNPDHSKVNAAVDVRYTLTPSSGSPAPTGNVVITGVNGATTVTCTATIAAGSCVFPLNALNAPGVWTFTANYAGDTNFNASSDTESHQVYYYTTVSLPTQTPPTSVYGTGTSIVVDYLITTDPAVSGSVKPVTLQIHTEGTLICDIAAPNWTGQCTLPAYSSAGTKTITATIPAGDPNFLQIAPTSVTHEVTGGLTTTTTITSIVNDDSLKTGFTIGDTARVYVAVTSSGGATYVPPGTVQVATSSGNFCLATLTNGSGYCTATLATRGTTGEVVFTASYLANGVYAGSTSGPSSITVAKAVPGVTLSGHVPASSGTGQAVVMSVDVTPVSGSLFPTGTVRVSVIGEALTCDAVLGVNNGKGSCSITFTTPGWKSLRLDYLGDSNYQSPNPAIDLINAHLVSSCPTIVLPHWLDLTKKVDSQMIVQLRNPNAVNYQLAEVNASWPTLTEDTKIMELQLNDADSDATDWKCSKQGQTLPPSCMWTNTAGLATNGPGNMTYYATAANGQTCQGSTGGGTCENWMSASQTAVNLNLGPAVNNVPTVRYMYFVLNYIAPHYHAYQIKVRLINTATPSDESCKWITAEFARP